MGSVCVRHSESSVGRMHGAAHLLHVRLRQLLLSHLLSSLMSPSAARSEAGAGRKGTGRLTGASSQGEECACEGSPGFPFDLSLVSLCSGSVPTVHLCAKVHTPSTHTGTGEGTGLEAGVLGLSVMMKSCLAVAVQLEAEEGTDRVPCSLLVSPASLHCCSFSASENHS